MNFFDLRKLLEPAFTFEGTDAIYDGKRYPLYSVQGVTNLLMDLKDKSKFEAVKQIVDEHTILLYGHTIDAQSITGYLKVWLQYLNDKDAPLVFNSIADGSWGNGTAVKLTIDSSENWVVDWGDGTIEAGNGTTSTPEHTYTKEDNYALKVYTFNDSNLISMADVNYNNIWVCKFMTPKNIISTGNNAYLYTTATMIDDPGQGFDVNFPVDSMDIYIGDNSLPIITKPNFDNTGIENASTIVVKIKGVQSFFVEKVFPADNLVTLKIQSEDLESFKKCMTYFNKGNTTANLTVLKGKHQEEAYQWATANGHFASIVKE